MSQERLYFDHNATSPLNAVARERLLDVLGWGPINAGSLHQEGQRARAAIERSRHVLKRLLPSTHAKVIFTSGATESNHLALTGLSVRAGESVWTSSLEHASVHGALSWLERGGVEVRTFSHTREGRVLLPSEAEFEASAPVAVTVAWANNELGNIQPIEELAERCRVLGVRLHVDASQVVGRFPWRVPQGVGALTVSGHKAGAPQGVGALVYDDGWPVGEGPLGGSQERGLRAGTENTAAIAALAAVIAAPDEAWARLGPRRDALEQGLEAALNVRVLGDRRRRLPNTASIAFPGRQAEELLMALDLAGISVSAGAACSAGAVDVSPVIAALGVPPEVASSVLRFSLGPEHTGLNVQEAVARIAAAIR